MAFYLFRITVVVAANGCIVSCAVNLHDCPQRFHYDQQKQSGVVIVAFFDARNSLRVKRLAGLMEISAVINLRRQEL